MTIATTAATAVATEAAVCHCAVFNPNSVVFCSRHIRESRSYTPQISSGGRHPEDAAGWFAHADYWPQDQPL